jgi:hypothetical protein
MNARVLKRALSSHRAYAIIDRYSLGDTWSSGGCWVLAEALHQFLPGSELFTIVADKGAGEMPQHVVAKWKGRYWDADGSSTQAQLLKRWAELERLRAPRLVKFRPEAVEGIICPVSAVHEVIELVSRAK